MRTATVSQPGQVHLEPGFGQSFAEQFVVAILKRYRVIPDLRRNVDRTMQVPEPLRPEKLEFPRLKRWAFAGSFCKNGRFCGQ